MGEFTGPFAQPHKLVYDTLEWLVEREGGQIAGRPVKFIRVDDQYKLDVALNNAKRLVELEKVHLILSTAHSGLNIGLKDYMASTKIPWILWETGTVHFYPPPNVVRLNATSHHMALPDIGRFLAETYGIKKAITIGLDYAAGRDVVDATKQILAGGNIEVIQEFWVPIDVADFGPYFSRMKLDEAQLLTGAMWASGALRLMTQAKEFGVSDKLKLAFGHMFAVDDFGLSGVGAAAEGVLNWFDFPSPDYPSPGVQKFVADYKEKFGVLPAYSWRGYMAFKLLKQAIEKVGGNVENSAALIEAIHQPVPLPWGTLYFDDCGNAITTVFLREIKMVDGQPQSTRVKEFKGARLPCPSIWE